MVQSLVHRLQPTEAIQMPSDTEICACRSMCSRNSTNSDVTDKSTATQPKNHNCINFSLYSTLEGDLVPGKGNPPEVPMHCCMTGCENCVWIVYAQEMADYYGDNGLRLKRVIDQSIDDPALKSFLLLELGGVFIPKQES